MIKYQGIEFPDLEDQRVISVCWFAGENGNFDEPFEEIGEGSEIVVWMEGEEGENPSDAYKLKIFAMQAGKTALEGVEVEEDTSPNKLFRAELLRTTAEPLFKGGSKDEPKTEDDFVMGVLFPDGFASIVENNHL